MLAEREEELRIAKKAAADAHALKADHNAAVSQLKEEHRNEMYLLQVILPFKTTEMPRVIGHFILYK